jgi:hypothetical protein
MRRGIFVSTLILYQPMLDTQNHGGKEGGEGDLMDAVRRAFFYPS